MQERDFKAIRDCLSEQRLGGYQAKQVEPLGLYKWNVALSESLYPLLNTVEVALRNRLHTEIAKIISHDTWLLDRDERILKLLHDHWTIKLDANIRDCRKKNKLDEGHLIAEMNFGFWTVLLGNQFEYQQFLWPKLKTIVFPFAHSIHIHEIRKQFKAIRNLRNRVFHYEAIWHWRDLQQKHDLIVEALKWLNPALLHLVEVDRFKAVYARGPNGKN